MEYDRYRTSKFLFLNHRRFMRLNYLKLNLHSYNFEKLKLINFYSVVTCHGMIFFLIAVFQYIAYLSKFNLSLINFVPLWCDVIK